MRAYPDTVWELKQQRLDEADSVQVGSVAVNSTRSRYCIEYDIGPILIGFPMR